MARIRLSPLIGNHMVLQQGQTIPVSGESAPEAEIAVSFLDKVYRTRADAGGKWSVMTDSQASGGPYVMEISAVENGGGSASGKITEKITTEKITVEDIYVGDVWLCSGQSNMELPMQRLKDNFPEEWDAPVNPLIRQFFVPQEWESSAPRRELSGGCWTPASQESLREFSGTAWFFARAMFEKHGTPVGLILAAWGGTPVEAWMSREALAAFPEKIAPGEKYADPAFSASAIQKAENEIQAWGDRLAAGDAGLAEAWYKPETDLSGWNEINLPGFFSGAGLDNFCGVLWLRREFEISGKCAGEEARLWLGTIVDGDTVYVNGVEVGGTDYRYPPRKYPVPAGLLREGKNHIVIRVVCRDGEGGVTRDKDFRIFSESGCAELCGTWKYRPGICAGGPRPEEFFLHRQPIGLFNAMIAPVLHFPCKGVLWYQGESNTDNPNEYSALFNALINDWRDKMRKEIPFLFVQLPVFGDPGENSETDPWALVREAQCSALSLPFAGMATGLDLGEWNDLHPLNKKDVGIRLALAAEKTVYNEQNTSPGPLLNGVRRGQGRLFLTFDNCGKGLTARETPYVSVLAGGKLFRLPAGIEGPDCLTVDISSVQNPEKVLYAWASTPRDMQLYNSDGLPVIPFRALIK